MKITKEMIDPEIYTIGKILDLLPLRNEKDFRLNAKLAHWLSHGKKSKKLKCDYFEITKRDGNPMRICVYSPLKKAEHPLPGILWTHGGGYACGVPEGEIATYERLMEWAPCVIVSPEYRLSLEAPYPAAVEDCYDALLWLKANAESWNIRPDQIALGGGSAGGGLAAALSIMARDRGEVNIAFQMPLFPMLDNTMSTQSMMDNNSVGWNEAKNAVGWELYLGKDYRSTEVSKYAAPARETDYRNLAPAFSYVGTCDPFMDETVDYIENLKKAGVEADCSVFEGGYHAFELNSPNSKIGKAAFAYFRERYQYAVANYFAPQKQEASK